MNNGEGFPFIARSYFVLAGGLASAELNREMVKGRPGRQPCYSRKNQNYATQSFLTYDTKLFFLSSFASFSSFALLSLNSFLPNQGYWCTQETEMREREERNSSYEKPTALQGEKTLVTVAT